MLARRIKNNNTTLNKKMPAIATSGIRGPIPVMILHPLQTCPEQCDPKKGNAQSRLKRALPIWQAIGGRYLTRLSLIVEDT
jgi:hypothetical protein